MTLKPLKTLNQYFLALRIFINTPFCQPGHNIGDFRNKLACFDNTTTQIMPQNSYLMSVGFPTKGEYSKSTL
jgi:hypothetical protein